MLACHKFEIVGILSHQPFKNRYGIKFQPEESFDLLLDNKSEVGLRVGSVKKRLLALCLLWPIRFYKNICVLFLNKSIKLGKKTYVFCVLFKI